MDAVEDIKGRLSIEDVISRYVELKRAGRNFRGLSPFNNEKTPSFMVSPEKQIWHDFSSGKGGNMFSFVMEMEGVDFRGALELLARQAGVDLTQYQSSHDGQRGKQKERLHEALELATKFYQIHFSKNKPALEYILKTRRYSKETALLFRIGYSPSSGDSLTKFLLGKGFTLQELKLAGLTTQRYGSAGQRTNDMFRGRIMIPLMDPFGRVIGFTARQLESDSNPSTSSGSASPKYINTPATLLYDKSRHVYGLHLAKEAIRQTGYAVVVEGNLDVIASHQAGIKQVVATAGTAMTEPHLKLLGRLTHDIRIAFDQDEAGLQAAERTIPIAGKMDISLSILTVSAGKDPDELIKKDPKAWQKVIDTPQYALDWLIERYKSILDITSAEGKRKFSDILLKVVQALPDSVEQDHYIVRLSKMIGVSADSLRTKLTRGSTGERKMPLRKAPTPVMLDAIKIEALKTQNHLLALCLMKPELRGHLESITPEMLAEKPAQDLLTFINKNPEFVWYDKKSSPKKLLQAPEVQAAGEDRKGGVPSSTSTATRSRERSNSGASTIGASGFAAGQDRTVQEFRDILLLLYEELYQGLEIVELRYEAARLQTRLIEQYVNIQKTILANAMRGAYETETKKLLIQAKALDALLKSNRESVNDQAKAKNQGN